MTPNPLAVYATNRNVDPENYERIAWLLMGEKVQLQGRIKELEGILKRDHALIETQKKTIKRLEKQVEHNLEEMQDLQVRVDEYDSIRP